MARGALSTKFSGLNSSLFRSDLGASRLAPQFSLKKFSLKASLPSLRECKRVSLSDRMAADALMSEGRHGEVEESISLSQEGGSDDDDTMITYVATNQEAQGRDDQPRRRTIITSSGMDVNDRVAADVLMSKYRGDVSRGGSPHTRRRDDLDELMFEHGAQTRESSDDSCRARRGTDDQLDLSEGGSDDDDTMMTYVATNQEAQGRDDQPRRRTIVTSSGMDVNDRVEADVLMSKYRGDVSRGGSPHTRRRDDLDELMFEHGAQTRESSDDSRRARRGTDDQLDLSEGGSDDDETMMTYVATNQEAQGRDDQPRRGTIVTSSGLDVNDRVAADILMSRYRGDVSRGGSPHTRRRDDFDELMFEHGAQTRESSDDSRRARRRTDDVLDLSEDGSDDDDDDAWSMHTVSSLKVLSRDDHRGRRMFDTASSTSTDRVAAEGPMTNYRREVSRGGSPYAQRSSDVDKMMPRRESMMNELFDDGRQTRRSADDVPGLAGSEDDGDGAMSMRTATNTGARALYGQTKPHMIVTSMDQRTGRVAVDELMANRRRDVGRIESPYAGEKSDTEEMMVEQEVQMYASPGCDRRTRRAGDDVPGLSGSVESVANAPPGAQRIASVKHRVVTPDDRELRGRRGRPLVERNDIVAGPEGGDNWSQQSEVQITRTAARRSMSDLPSTLPMCSCSRGGREAELEETPRAPPAYSSRGAERRCTTMFTRPATKARVARNSTGRCASVPVAIADETGGTVGTGSETDVRRFAQPLLRRPEALYVEQQRDALQVIRGPMFEYMGDGRRMHSLEGPMYDDGREHDTHDDSIRHVANRPGAGRFPNEDDTHYGQHSGRSRRQEAESRESYSHDDDEVAMSMHEVSSRVTLSRGHQAGQRRFDAAKSRSMDRVAAEVPMTSHRGEVGGIGSPYAQRSGDVEAMMSRQEVMMSELSDDDGRRADDVLSGSEDDEVAMSMREVSSRVTLSRGHQAGQRRFDAAKGRSMDRVAAEVPMTSHRGEVGGIGSPYAQRSGDVEAMMSRQEVMMSELSDDDRRRMDAVLSGSEDGDDGAISMHTAWGLEVQNRDDQTRQRALVGDGMPMTSRRRDIGEIRSLYAERSSDGDKTKPKQESQLYQKSDADYRTRRGLGALLHVSGGDSGDDVAAVYAAGGQEARGRGDKMEHMHDPLGCDRQKRREAGDVLGTSRSVESTIRVPSRTQQSMDAKYRNETPSVRELMGRMERALAEQRETGVDSKGGDRGSQYSEVQFGQPRIRRSMSDLPPTLPIHSRCDVSRGAGRGATPKATLTYSTCEIERSPATTTMTQGNKMSPTSSRVDRSIKAPTTPVCDTDELADAGSRTNVRRLAHPSLRRQEAMHMTLQEDIPPLAARPKLSGNDNLRRKYGVYEPPYGKGDVYGDNHFDEHVMVPPIRDRPLGDGDKYHDQYGDRDGSPEARYRGRHDLDDDETTDAMIERRLAALRGKTYDVAVPGIRGKQLIEKPIIQNYEDDEVKHYVGRRDVDDHAAYTVGTMMYDELPRGERESLEHAASRDRHKRITVQRHASAYVARPEPMQEYDAHRTGLPVGRPSSCAASDSRLIMQQRTITHDRCRSSMAIGQCSDSNLRQLKNECGVRLSSAFRPVQTNSGEARQSDVRERPPRMMIQPQDVPAPPRVERVVETNPFHTMRNPGWSPGKQRPTEACSKQTMDQEMRGLTKADVCHCHGTYRHDLLRRDATPECTDFDDVDRMSMAVAVRRRYSIEQEAQPQPVRRSKRVADKQESARKGARQSECVPAKQKDQTTRKQSVPGDASRRKEKRDTGKEPMSGRTKTIVPPSDESDDESDSQHTEAKPPPVGDDGDGKRRCRGAGDGDKQGGKEPPKNRAKEDNDRKAEKSRGHDAGKSSRPSKRGAQSGGGPPDDDPSDDSSSDDERDKKRPKSHRLVVGRVCLLPKQTRRLRKPKLLQETECVVVAPRVNT